MSDDKMGGPAFPGEQGIGPEGEWNETFNRGMTLWDYYAAAALTGLIASNDPGAGDRIDEIPEYAGWIADAMLAERTKREKGDER